MLSKNALSKEANQQLQTVLINLETNPYKDYLAFSSEIKDLIISGKLPSQFTDLMAQVKNDRINKLRYAHLIENTPVDLDVPLFDRTDPVTHKYEVKKTFIGEGILQIMSILTDAPLLAYDTRTNGDFFHDIYPIDKYQDTQTQKTDGELYFHNDRTAHPIRADYLHLLGMTPNRSNNIYTGYVDGRDILKYLTSEEQNILRTPYFYTPYDEYSRDSNDDQIDSANHAILIEEHSFRYYDARTTYANDAPKEAIMALLALKTALTRADKHYVKITQGTLFGFANLSALHSKQLIEIKNIDEARHRWILKTYNFGNTQRMENFNQFFYPNVPGLVNDSLVVPN